MDRGVMAYVLILLTISRFERSFSAAILGVEFDSDDELLDGYLCNSWENIRRNDKTLTLSMSTTATGEHSLEFLCIFAHKPARVGTFAKQERRRI